MQRRHFLTAAAQLAGGSGALALAGCGFHLRGPVTLVFHSIVFEASPNSAVVNQLKRLLQSQVQVLEPAQRARADVVMQVHDDRQTRVATVPGSAGTVLDVQLHQIFTFSLVTPAGKILIDHATLDLMRDVSYNASEATAKEAEFVTLYRDLVNDTVQQVLRRLAAVKSL